MKKKILTAVSVLVILCTSVVASLAYFTDYDIASNAVKTDLSGKLEISETFDKLSKNVSIKNTGTTEIFVAVSVTAPDPRYNNSVEKITNALETATDWTKGDDGLFYYKNVLTPEGEEGIHSVDFKIRVETAYGYALDEIDFDIIVVANYVQAAYNENNEADMDLSWSLANRAKPEPAPAAEEAEA